MDEQQWNTIYADAENARESASLLMDPLIHAISNDHEEDWILLEKVQNYLYDRFDVEIDFCSMLAGNQPTENDDIPF